MDIPGMPIDVRVRELREAIGWSLSKLSKKSGVSRSYLYDIEHGNSSPTYATIIKLCHAFDVRPAVLTDNLYDASDVFKRLNEIRDKWG